MNTVQIVALCGIVSTVVFSTLFYWLGCNNGALSEISKNLDETIRRHSWATVELAQSEFNIDFFDTLWETNDPRVRGYIDG